MSARLRILITPLIVAFAFLAFVPVASAEDESLSGRTLDELLSVELTALGRRGQKRSEMAAAVFVITKEDIRRSGVRTVPEVLRMVPGVHVARISGSVWAVSIRGFSQRFSNKLLVLVDGRSVYTPLFSGVHWDAQDILLEDVERIEVIRGPGGTLWGPNAVNGIISIVTKGAAATQGTLVSATATEHGRDLAVRFGGAVGPDAYYRVYAKHLLQAGSRGPEGDILHDDLRIGRVGGQLDWTLDAKNTITTQVEAYDGHAGDRSSIPDLRNPVSELYYAGTKLSGGHVSARWDATQSGRSQTSMHAYAERVHRDKITFSEFRTTFDLEFTHNLTLGKRHKPSWGAGFRANSDDLSDPDIRVKMLPARERSRIASLYVQDEISILPQLRLTVGTKVHRDRSFDAEFQPSGRLVWMPSRDHSVWAAATRAARTPSRLELGMRIPVGTIPANGGPMYLMLRGNEDVQPERVITYEVGYRFHQANVFTFDATAFQNHLSNLIVAERGAPIRENGHRIIPLNMANGAEGRTSGFELAATYHPSAPLELTAAYALFDADIRDPEGRLHEDALANALVPRHHLQVTARSRLAPRIDFDTTVAYLTAVEQDDLDAHLRVDARLAWQARHNLELSLVGQNLVSDGQIEFRGLIERHSITPTERRFHAGLRWHF